MGFVNIISNQWYQVRHLDPISHLNGSEVKPMKEFRAEMKEFLPQIYNEHEILLKNKEDGLIVRAFKTIGTFVAGKYSFSDFKSMFDYDVSPISHYDATGKLKTQKEFKTELKDHLGTIYTRHQDLIDYDNSSYIELSAENCGKALSSLFSGGIFSAALYTSKSTIYAIPASFEAISYTLGAAFQGIDTTYHYIADQISKFHQKETCKIANQYLFDGRINCSEEVINYGIEGISQESTHMLPSHLGLDSEIFTPSALI